MIRYCISFCSHNKIELKQKHSKKKLHQRWYDNMILVTQQLWQIGHTDHKNSIKDSGQSSDSSRKTCDLVGRKKRNSDSIYIWRGKDKRGEVTSPQHSTEKIKPRIQECYFSRKLSLYYKCFLISIICKTEKNIFIFPSSSYTVLFPCVFLPY